MSVEEATSRKAKKAQRDAERKKTGKKRKREEAGEEAKVNGQDELKNDFISLAGGDETTIAKDTASSKKRKLAKTKLQEGGAEPEAASESSAKKRKRSKMASTTSGGHGDSAANGEAGSAETAGDAGAGVSSKPAKSRFILFIGNLPYSATDESITAHFKSIQPFTLRHRTDPKTKKSKGFAFLEFENFDRMKTCLKLYHHSTFDPDASEKGTAQEEQTAAKPGGKRGKKDKSRRINVELTAGGGGKGDERKEKIKVKNAKLEEERKRRREAEEKAEARKEKKRKTGANAAPTGTTSKADEATVESEAGEAMQGVHPARLARMKA